MKKILIMFFFIVGILYILLPKNMDLYGNINKPKTINLEVFCCDKEGYFLKKYTCDGENVNPKVIIKNIPKETKLLLLILYDPDAPKKNFLHWYIYTNKISDPLIIPENVPKVEKYDIFYQGKNDFFPYRSYGFVGIGYEGPCPPRGTHRYVFRVFAFSKEEIDYKNIIAYGEFIAKYSR